MNKDMKPTVEGTILDTIKGIKRSGFLDKILDMQNGGKEAERKENEGLTVEQLVKKYNWYRQKLIVLPEGTSLKHVKTAIAQFIRDNEDWDEVRDAVEEMYPDDNDEADITFEADRVEDDDVNIVIKSPRQGFAVVQVICGDDEGMYTHDMFEAIDEYLESKKLRTCPSCGEQLPMKGNFCLNCGAPLA